MLIISPFTFNQNNESTTAIALSLGKVNRMIREVIREEQDRNGEEYGGILDGVDFIMDCLIKNVVEIATEFERLKYWAEDANVHITHDRYFGKEIRHELRRDDCKRPGTMALIGEPTP